MEQVKYHSTGQFRNAIKTVKIKEMMDENSKPLDHIVDYIGTVKLHGTNASIVIQADGSLSYHSKNNTLGYRDNTGFTLLTDNAAFAQTMDKRITEVGQALILEEILGGNKKIGIEQHPIKLSGEWAGSGVQKGVGISQLKDRGFFLFGIKLGDSGWIRVDELPNLKCLHKYGIYSIMDFPTFRISIDFNNPEFSQNKLVEITEEVENCCPVSHQLGLTNAEGNPSLLGEGLVWTPLDDFLVKNTDTWFKTKGKKHSISKTKSVAPIDTEVLNNIQEFVSYAVTTNRLEQGIQEVGVDEKSIGKFIGWVNQDINKEESDVLKSNNLTMKDVGKYCSNKAREYYLTVLNNS